MCLASAHISSFRNPQRARPQREAAVGGHLKRNEQGTDCEPRPGAAQPPCRAALFWGLPGQWNRCRVSCRKNVSRISRRPQTPQVISCTEYAYAASQLLVRPPPVPIQKKKKKKERKKSCGSSGRPGLSQHASDYATRPQHISKTISAGLALSSTHQRPRPTLKSLIIDRMGLARLTVIRSPALDRSRFFDGVYKLSTGSQTRYGVLRTPTRALFGY